MSGINVVAVQFRRAGKMYTFSCDGIRLAQGDVVVVDTERGMSLAEVKRVGYIEHESAGQQPLKPVVRVANVKDLKRGGRITPEFAQTFTLTKIRDLNLDMRLIEVDVHFGGNKVIVYFSAPGRVDFRELVKELASGLKSRVELKQVGARDEAKLLGGLGICGREFCCTSWLRDFLPVSIKMAKNQNLALNPSKVSGGCGRLLCCLTYEDKTYQQLRKELPAKGTKVELQSGVAAVVQGSDPINKKLLVETIEREKFVVALHEIKIIEPATGRPMASGDSEDDDLGDALDGEMAALQEDSLPDLEGSVDGEGRRARPQEGQMGRRDGPQRSNRDGRDTRGRGAPPQRNQHSQQRPHNPQQRSQTPSAPGRPERPAGGSDRPAGGSERPTGGPDEGQKGPSDGSPRRRNRSRRGGKNRPPRDP